MNRTMYYTKMGRYFGYPECCIKHFIKNVHTGRRPSLNTPLLGTGYVACKNCSKLSEDILIKRINLKRDKNLKPFIP